MHGRPTHVGGRRSGPSIADVAKLADVSSQTVSRVANGSSKVRESTRTRVIAAMQMLGYAPNVAARALRRGTFKTIGLLGHHFERTGEALTTSALISAATAEDYAVTIVTVKEAPDSGWDRAASQISGQAIDGLVILRTERTPEELMLPPSFPVAVSDARLAGFYPAVSTDHEEGSRAATNHLLSLGHRQVYHIAGPEDSEAAAARLLPWQQALIARGIRPPAPIRGDWSAESGYTAARQLATQEDVTAIYCANDEMAIGALRAFHELGLRVPHDVSVVGFDDLTISSQLPLPLTTVKQDFHAIGTTLFDLVLEQINAAGKSLSRKRVMIRAELIIRATTAPPSSRDKA